MQTNHNTGLFIFRHDLRLADNPGLASIAARCKQLLCVFIIDEAWFNENQFGLVSMGEHRQVFLRQTLNDLSSQLENYQQKLHILSGDFLQTLDTLIAAVQPSIVSCNGHCGFNEVQDENGLQALCVTKNIECEIHAETGLVETAKLPFNIVDMPDVFSPFRRKVEKQPILRTPIAAPQILPPALQDFNYQSSLECLLQASNKQHFEQLVGGEKQAIKQLNYYLFETDFIAKYKLTRNGLDGWSFSSKLSAWLANGSISAAIIAQQINSYESERQANDSTYWLVFELLWREFFHLQAHKQKTKLFSFSGIQSKQPTTKFNAETFAKWCIGKTGFDIVDACMRQLNNTGFMSNRGRQLVASCFVHELGLDWRYGAAYFEQQLIDFDVASNWGNWQYLAGVGSDPRGHRQFNLQKQTKQYDPQRAFINKWLS